MLTVNEVSRILQDHEHRDENYPEYDGDSGWSAWDELVPYSETSEREKTRVPELGTVEMMPTYTGGEGGGEDCEMVFKVTDHFGQTRWFRLNGYYLSYDGTTWDGDLYEVHPREKTITVYE